MVFDHLKSKKIERMRKTQKVWFWSERKNLFLFLWGGGGDGNPTHHVDAFTRHALSTTQTDSLYHGRLQIDRQANCPASVLSVCWPHRSILPHTETNFFSAPSRWGASKGVWSASMAPSPLGGGFHFFWENPQENSLLVEQLSVVDVIGAGEEFWTMIDWQRTIFPFPTPPASLCSGLLTNC